MTLAQNTLSLDIDSIVSCRGRDWRVTHIPASDHVLAEDLETGSRDRLTIQEILDGASPSPDVPQTEAVERPDLSDFTEEQWAEATRRYKIIESLADKEDLSRSDVAAMAKRSGTSTSTLYRWLGNYRTTRQISALIPARRGPKKGTKRLDPNAELVIRNVIEDNFLTKQRRKASTAIVEIHKRCRSAGITPPPESTIRRRFAEIPAAAMLRRRGHNEEAANRFRPIIGHFPGADQPLAVVQMDHTKLDVIVVDDTTRRPLGRPYITVALDVYSRMVLGFYVSMEAAGALAAGLCLTMAILPKDRILSDLGIPGKWPAYGLMRSVHLDNAKEFRGNVLKRAFDEYAIDLKLRPAKTPHFGGHIERFMGRLANLMHTLPGTTFSSPSKRKGYDAEKEATLTLGEVERFITEFIVNVYHRDFHDGIQMAPIDRWTSAIAGDDLTPGIGLPKIPTDARKLAIDFLPFEERTIQKYGLVIEGIHYYHEVLSPLIGSRDPVTGKPRKYVVRYDPRDMSQVYLSDPDTASTHPIPYRDTSRPKASLWSIRQATAEARRRGLANVDEDAIFAALDRQDALVAEAAATTKDVRKTFQRRVTTNGPAVPRPVGRAPAGHPARPIHPAPPPAVKDDLDSLFATPAAPFDDIAVSKPRNEGADE
ncbi:Mu transposase C-terminal domain-containing protein [uncultured Bosea sp.]|uniref:Mu transposase C-terminal domain-containing protein n=1 Tax=uncultured Bosea sp. TaxID=211457 RepID=UPI0025EB7326|nr:Mu transposase C-terminal domain-containing protein [uncultured Bosea sp.]